MTKWIRQNTSKLTTSFVILLKPIKITLIWLFLGQVQPDDAIVARVPVDGAERRGFPVFQTHAGKCPSCHTPHGDAPCKEKITYHWVCWPQRISQRGELVQRFSLVNVLAIYSVSHGCIERIPNVKLVQQNPEYCPFYYCTSFSTILLSISTSFRFVDFDSHQPTKICLLFCQEIWK